REDQTRVDRLVGDEHVMAPYEEPDHRDRDARERHEPVPEDALAREAWHDLADDTHAGKNHYVYGWVRIKPEQVLKENRIASELRIEDPYAEETLSAEREETDREHRCSKYED